MSIFNKNVNIECLKKKVVFITCKYQTNIINKIMKICSNQSLEILEISTYLDTEINIFFIRLSIQGYFQDCSFLYDFHNLLPSELEINCHNVKKPKIILLATKESHCIGNLLIKKKFGHLYADILAIISNHKILKPLVKLFHIPYYYIDHYMLSNEEHSNKILEISKKFKPDYIILAKYMRILTSKFVQSYHNKIINVHHSILPSFTGAKPYLQAYKRGVKIIGATAHYVNNYLDSGPIIFQDVVHIDHTYSLNDMIRIGHDMEQYVLNRALYLIFSNRVLIFKNRTIIF
ncbi:formyltetrahydrofolate hydrolase [Wigglesworthia glossinidia endosymbiont of Glossina morsitans morsitans (Yale colony)]|uniref:Formyltetrahydrofolate deformylase n=1 Tax=Wigglesworthia glossinidia endosymbiont of Glossina morsitans morsitans (Yale colony) TaxID=1142511 RepID=H6Q4U5_WIGGL|nr:formyltetrahydrofolate deformylase [Wigglesworthia glossinidia]AFA41228.1 formyltetrahydrofolate hydrolase [Wigglesworthia glossinidia endosymbiont of Glossina morsitans morsitans (Yale colony)]